MVPTYFMRTLPSRKIAIFIQSVLFKISKSGKKKNYKVAVTKKSIRHRKKKFTPGNYWNFQQNLDLKKNNENCSLITKYPYGKCFMLDIMYFWKIFSNEQFWNIFSIVNWNKTQSNIIWNEDLKKIHAKTSFFWVKIEK